MADEEIKRQTFLKESAMNLDTAMQSHARRVQVEFAQSPDKAPGELDKAFKKELGKLAKNSPFPRAREDFLFAGESYGIKAREQITKWADQQKIENFTFANDKLANNQSVGVYRNPFDEELYKQTQANLSAIANDFSATMDPQLVNEKNRAYRQAGALSRFQGILDTAVKSASAGKLKESDKLIKAGQKLLDSKEFDYDLGSDGVAKVNRALKLAKRRKAAAAKDFTDLKLKDPYGYLRKTGVNIPPLDPADPESVEARLEIRPQLEQREGIVLPLMSPYEAGIWTRDFERLEPDAQKKKLDAIKSNRPEAARELVNQLFANKPEYAAALHGIMLGSAEGDQISNTVIEGSDFIRKNKDSKMLANLKPKEEDFMAYVDKEVGPLIRDAKSKEAVTTAAMAAVLQKRRETGKSGKTFTSDDRKVVDNVVSSLGFKPYQLGDSYLRRPQDPRTRQFVDDDRMRAITDNITNDVLQKTHGSAVYNKAGNIFDIDDSQSRVIYVPADDGGYKLYFNEQKLLNKDGREFRLYLDRINSLPDIKKRGFMDKLSNIIQGIGGN
jgi:CRISPR/Cas system CSM-associated protein Csm2 small subunit